jgi:glycosyltransferase involved in cell wall biosynthesis
MSVTLNPKIASARCLYATSARIGGSGLDAVAAETLRAIEGMGADWNAVAFDRRAPDLPSRRIHSLRWHPVRLLSWIVGREAYYGAKKHALDRTAAARLRRGGIEVFHGWSGECVRSLRECRRLGIPSLIEIPTWHRHKGRAKPSRLTKSERERAAAQGWTGFKNSLLISRQQMLEEYELADQILVLSEKAEETFLAAGVPKEKLFRHQRGVDPDRFSPAPQPPEIFRCVFVGAVIERKGVHRLLEAWHRLALEKAELVLAGTVHEEIKPWLKKFATPSVRVAGFLPRVEQAYREATVHVFPSECEGSAKCTYEAASCGLPQITTKEAGDVVEHGVNGLIVPCDDIDALASAIHVLHSDRALCGRLGAAGRQRVLERFTWAHFRERVGEAYSRLMAQR